MLNDIQVQALIVSAASREMLKRRWLIDALTCTNTHDVEVEAPSAVKIGDVIEIAKDKFPSNVVYGQVVGVNKEFTGILLDDTETAFLVAVLGDSKNPIFHRLDVFDPGKYLSLIKEKLGVNPFTDSCQWCKKTTVGRFIENVIVLQYPTNFKVFEYLNRVWDCGDLFQEVSNMAYEKKITVQEYKKFVDHLFYLNHITEICTPSMTERSLMTNPKVAEIKRKFIEEHKDQMHDPLVIKQLEDMLIAADKEWLGKGTDHEDPSVTYIDGLGSKTWDLHRKKLFLTTGGIPAFDTAAGRFDFIANSMMEGWTIPTLPNIANEIRKGSYERGRETAKGGAETKLVMRVFQDLMVDKDDCGTKRTITVDFNTCRVKDFIGRYVQEGAKDVEITEENMKQFEGKVVKIYSPLTCEHKYNLCFKCCGRRARDLGAEVIGIQVVKITSTFMLKSMKNMHGTVLQTTQPKLQDIFL